MRKSKNLQNDFLYAVACYENRETDAAKESFEHIISYAPRMNVASISQKYVEAIDQNRSPLLPDTEVLPDDSYQMHDARTAAKIRRYGIIKRIVIIIVVALLALTYYIDKREKMKSVHSKSNSMTLWRRNMEKQFGLITLVWKKVRCMLLLFA